MGMIMAKKTKGWFVQENVYVICAYQIVTFFVRRANGDNGAWHVAETLAQLHLSYVGTCVLLASFNVKLSWGKNQPSTYFTDTGPNEQ